MKAKMREKVKCFHNCFKGFSFFLCNYKIIMHVLYYACVVITFCDVVLQVRPKMGKIDIDYQKLHDAFFK